jgi:hypothetical protein
MNQKAFILKLVMAGLCVMGLTAQAQAIKVRGQILADSIKIGKPFPYSLAVEYPSEIRLLFPDSAFRFTPFEFADKQYFPTVTTNGISKDSAVYYLETYEVDSLQSLALPIFVLTDSDSTAVFADPDQVWLHHLVTMALDSIDEPKLPLKVNTQYEPVPSNFNYVVAGLIGAVVFVLLIIAWIIFGKRIVQSLKIRRMRKAFDAFAQKFAHQVESMKTNYSPAVAEQSLVLWKQYLETLEGRPLTKFSSTEIVQATGHDILRMPLNTVDRLIYAGEKPQSFDAFYDLKSYSEDRFQQKLQELKQTAA